MMNSCQRVRTLAAHAALLITTVVSAFAAEPTRILIVVGRKSQSSTNPLQNP